MGGVDGSLPRSGMHDDGARVPTLILHGDDDQIVPIGASAMQSSKLITNATLEVYEGAPHGMCTTHEEQVNADLLAFLES